MVKKGAADAAEAVIRKAVLLDQIVESTKLGKDHSQKRGKDLLREFIAQVLNHQITIAPDTEAMISARIAQIDRLVSLQLNEIMQHPDFQKMEGSWRGLRDLLDRNAEIAEWEQKLLESCLSPEPHSYPGAADGSRADYDPSLRAVVETDARGVRRLLSLRNGELHRSEPVRTTQATDSPVVPFPSENEGGKCGPTDNL